MNTLPSRRQQIIDTHAQFIRQAVELIQNPARRQELEALLQSAESQGWTALGGALREFASGRRDTSALGGLDEEDRVIAEAILQGLQNPANLPDASARPDPTLAAPGLAGMIQTAASGNVQALQLISEMATQMNRAGGAMAQLAAVIRPLINGERDAERLCAGKNAQTRQLIVEILEQLGKGGTQ